MNKYKREAREAAKARSRERMCGRKLPFETEADALTGGATRAYECPFCKKWHRTAALDKLAGRVKRR
jgi:hypothetical protein